MIRSLVVGGAGVALTACGLAAIDSGGANRVRRTLITVAHADDNLLFMSPDEYTLIRGGSAVQVVYLTTGDLGRGEEYARLREQGARAATAYMAGARDRWHRGSLHAHGYTLALETLADDPRLSIVFMRLPDGRNGSGWPDTGNQSLMRLWTGDIPTITSADHTTFTRGQLVDTLLAVANHYRPDSIYTQDFLSTFEDGDHSDHVTTGYLTLNAAQRYSATPCTVVGYKGYPIHLLAPNVSGSLLDKKEHTFLVYSRYDPAGCSPLAQCFATGYYGATYGSWFERQYIAGRVPAGPPRGSSGSSVRPN